MKILKLLLVGLAFIFLCCALYAKLFGHPPFAMGVRIISLVTMANTALLFALLVHHTDKK